MDDKTPPPAPDYAALAQRYLELWQDQVARLAKDPPKDLGDLSAMTAAWSKMASAMAQPPGDAYDPAAGAPRAAAAAPSYGDGRVDRSGGHGGPDAAARHVSDRLDAIEQRLGAIESKLAALASPGTSPGAPPGSARSGAAGGRGGRGKKS